MRSRRGGRWLPASWVGAAAQRAAVRKLMSADRNAWVRLRAAQGILAARDASALPVLIDLLREPSVAMGWQAEELLRWAAAAAPKEVYGKGSERERNACHAAWSGKRWLEWWGLAKSVAI